MACTGITYNWIFQQLSECIAGELAKLSQYLSLSLSLSLSLFTYAYKPYKIILYL